MPPTPIAAVVFDYGGVLINPITGHIDRVAQRHGVSMEDLLYVLMGPREVSTADHPWHRAERGEIPTSEMMEGLGPWAAEKGITLAGDEYDEIMSDDYHARPRVVAAIRALRAAGYKVALLTNSFKEYREFIGQTVDMTIFDEVIDSSEVGYRKPEPRIYDLVTERMGVPAGQILYIDDFLANVVGAREHGWVAEHITGEQAVLDAIAAHTGVTV